MSGDVQPRKRKDKKRKKDDVEPISSSTPPLFPRDIIEDVNIHVHKEDGTGGGICAKIVFFVLFSALIVLIGLIITEHRGLSDLDVIESESKYSQIFEGWVDEKHDRHHTLDDHDNEHFDDEYHDSNEHTLDDHDNEHIDDEVSEEQSKEHTLDDHDNEHFDDEPSTIESEENEQSTENESQDQEQTEEESRENPRYRRELSDENEDDDIIDSHHDTDDDSTMTTAEIDEEDNDSRPKEDEEIDDYSKEEGDNEEKEDLSEDNSKGDDHVVQDDSTADTVDDDLIPDDESQENIKDISEEKDEDEIQESDEIKYDRPITEEEIHRSLEITDDNDESEDTVTGTETKTKEDITDTDNEDSDIRTIDEILTNTDNPGPNDNNGSFSIIIKAIIGAAIMAVGHYVLVKKWRSDSSEENNIENLEIPVDLTRRHTLIPPPPLQETVQNVEYPDEDYCEEEVDLKTGDNDKGVSEIAKENYRQLRSSYSRSISPESEVSDENNDVESDEEIQHIQEEEEELEEEMEEEEEELDELQDEEDIEEEEEEIDIEESEEDDDEELLKKLEAKYGRLKTNPETEDRTPSPELEESDSEKLSDDNNEYEFSSFTNKDDWPIRKELDEAQQNLPNE